MLLIKSFYVQIYISSEVNKLANWICLDLYGYTNVKFNPLLFKLGSKGVFDPSESKISVFSWFVHCLRHMTKNRKKEGGGGGGSALQASLDLKSFKLSWAKLFSTKYKLYFLKKQFRKPLFLFYRFRYMICFCMHVLEDMLSDVHSM